MKRFKKYISYVSTSVLAMSSFFVLGPAAVSFAAAQTCTWDGSAGDNKFSTADNWTNCGTGAPLAGDVIAFTYASVNDAEVYTNDLGVALGGVTLTGGASGSSAKYVYISELELADGAVVEGGGYGLIATVGTGDTATADITAVGDVTLKTVTLSGKSWQVAGKLTVDGPTLYMNEQSTMGSLEVKAGSEVSYDTPSTATVSNSTPILLNGDSANGRALAFYPQCTAGMYSCTATAPTTYTLSGAVTATVPTKVFLAKDVTLNLTGAVTGEIVKTADSQGILNIGGTTVGDEVKTTTLDGDKPSEAYTVAKNETAILTGTRSSITVVAGGILKGTGSTQYSITINEGGMLAPGMSPGCVSAASLYEDGEYQVEIGGTEACTGYDQTKVLGNPTVTEPLQIGDTATLATVLFGGFTPAAGQSFTIIDNQSDKPVTGTFKDLPEGASFTQNGVTYKISYVGGTGNDVVLTVVSVPGTPDTGFALLRSKPEVILLAAMICGGALVVLARQLKLVEVSKILK